MTRPRVVLIGPVFPFRGGIGQHTTYLAREMQAICDLHVISFSRQFPRWLYPGESDRAPDAPAPGLDNLSYDLDSINPLTWWRTIRRIRALKPDLVIFPWWTFFLGPVFGTIARGCRRAGIEVRIVCHNADEHEGAWWKRAIFGWVLRGGDAIQVHSQADKALLQRSLPTPISVFPHPIYSGFPAPQGALDRRAQVEILFFGLIRPYKGLDILIEALPHLSDLDWHLSVVGEFWDGRDQVLARIEALGLQDRIEMVSSYVSDADAALYFARSDMVVNPYRKATVSGVVPLAYRYGKPVVASRLGGLEDQIDDGLTGALVTPLDPQALADGLRAVAASDQDWPAMIARKQEQTSWARLAAHLTARPFDPDISVRADGAANDPEAAA